MDYSQVQLKEIFKPYFQMGAAFDITDNTTVTDKQFFLKHFNAVTPENSFKWSSLEPQENQYQFTQADLLYQFAIQNNLTLNGIHYK